MATRIRNGIKEEYTPKVLIHDRKIIMKMNKDLHEKSKQYAKEHGISFSKMVRESLIKYMEEENGTLD